MCRSNNKMLTTKTNKGGVKIIFHWNKRSIINTTHGLMTKKNNRHVVILLVLLQILSLVISGTMRINTTRYRNKMRIYCGIPIVLNKERRRNFRLLKCDARKRRMFYCIVHCVCIAHLLPEIE